MDSALLLLKLLPLLLLCCTGPGLLIVSRLRWSPLEKLCGALAASYVAIYLASFALFCLNAPPAAYWTISLVFAAMAIPALPAARMFLRRRQTRTALFTFCALFFWYALHLAMVRNYSGGGWQGDWHEHFERTQYFLHELPNDYLYLGAYALPARPPMMNLIAAFFCRQVGPSFQAFQFVFLFLNAWTILPCCLLLRFFARRASSLIHVLAVLFMLNPSILQNSTLTITKAFTAGLVILGLCYYLRGRLLPAALTLAAGILAHYSAAPYAAAIALHCLFQFIRRHHSLGRIIPAAAGASVLLATWFGWSLLVYGPRITFLSNSTATGAIASSAPANLHKTVHNLWTSALPYPLHLSSAIPSEYRSPRNWGDIRDAYFSMAQTTLLMMIGLTGGAVALLLFIQYLFAPADPTPPRKAFWLFFIFFTYFVGIAAEPGRGEFGVAQVALQSLALIGVTLIASRILTLPSPVFWILFAGSAVDYALGILLEFDRQSYIYPTALDSAGRLSIYPDPTLGLIGAKEFAYKELAGYIFWGDRLAALSSALEITSLLFAAAALWRLRSSRHKDQPL